MGRRRRWKSKGLPAPGPATHDADPVTRSIAVNGDRVAIASGRRWRVVDIKEQAELHTDISHEGPIRGIDFSADGQFMVTCADDKSARSWSTADWSCFRILKAAKKASACAISASGKHIFFSDRFGDVLTAATVPATDKRAAAAEEPHLLLGHLQAIISSLSTCESSTGQQLLISTDRDGKVRASVLPQDPTQGSYEIQSYCLGHTNFVTCAAAVPRCTASQQQQQQQQQLIVSGGGDGTVRLWDVDTGKQLALYVASEQPPPVAILQQQQQQGDDAGDESGSSDEGSESDQDEQQQQQQEQQQAGAKGGEGTLEGQEQEDAGNDSSSKASKPVRPPIQRQQYAAVLSLAVSPAGTSVAAAVEGQQEVQILRLNRTPGAYTLELQQKLGFKDVCNPAAVTFDGHGRLWVVGGVLKLDTESAHVGVAAAAAAAGDDFKDVTAEVLPDSLRSYLECRVEQEEDEQAAGQQQIGYYHEGFKRKVYQRDENDPKKPRTHLKEAERLKALREAEDRRRQQQQEQAGKGQLDEAGSGAGKKK